MACRLVILGATGRLGRILAAGLSRRDDIDLVLQSRTLKPGHVTWNPDDGPDGLARHLEGADVVLNLIGVTPAGQAASAHLDEVNSTLALQISSIAQNAGVPRVLMASSAAVYGRPDHPDQVFHEDDAVAPLSDYARSKVAMESAVFGQPDPGTIVLRIANVAGADALLSQLVSALAPVDLTLHRFATGGSPARSYIGPQQFADSIAAVALAQNLPGCLNITAPGLVTMYDLLMAWEVRKPGSFTLSQTAAPSSAIETVALSSDRLCSVMGDGLKAANATQLVDEVLDMQVALS